MTRPRDARRPPGAVPATANVPLFMKGTNSFTHKRLKAAPKSHAADLRAPNS